MRLPMTKLTGPPKLLFHMNGWSWLMLHNFLNPLNQARAGLSKLPDPIPIAKWLGLALEAGILGSQLGFAWESPSPAQVAATSDCFIAQAG